MANLFLNISLIVLAACALHSFALANDSSSESEQSSEALLRVARGGRATFNKCTKTALVRHKIDHPDMNGRARREYAKWFCKLIVRQKKGNAKPLKRMIKKLEKEISVAKKELRKAKSAKKSKNFVQRKQDMVVALEMALHERTQKNRRRSDREIETPDFSDAPPLQISEETPTIEPSIPDFLDEATPTYSDM